MHNYTPLVTSGNDRNKQAFNSIKPSQTGINRNKYTFCTISLLYPTMHLYLWFNYKTKNVKKKGATLYLHAFEKTLCQTYKELPELLKSAGTKRKTIMPVQVFPESITKNSHEFLLENGGTLSTPVMQECHRYNFVCFEAANLQGPKIFQERVLFCLPVHKMMRRKELFSLKKGGYFKH